MSDGDVGKWIALAGLALMVTGALMLGMPVPVLMLGAGLVLLIAGASIAS